MSALHRLGAARRDWSELGRRTGGHRGAHRRQDSVVPLTPASRRAYSGIGTGEARCTVAVQLVPIEARMISPIALH